MTITAKAVKPKPLRGTSIGQMKVEVKLIAALSAMLSTEKRQISLQPHVLRPDGNDEGWL